VHTHFTLSGWLGKTTVFIINIFLPSKEYPFIDQLSKAIW
jgi:hypothetical protein